MDTSIWAGLLAESPTSHSPRRKSPTWFTWGCLISAHIFPVNYKWRCIVLYSYRSPISQQTWGLKLYPSCILRMFPRGPKLYTTSAAIAGGSLCLVDRFLRQMLVAGLRTSTMPSFFFPDVKLLSQHVRIVLVGMYIYLVGGLEHFIFFHITIIPFNFHIFQRGRSTTNQIWIRWKFTTVD